MSMSRFCYILAAIDVKFDNNLLEHYFNDIQYFYFTMGMHVLLLWFLFVYISLHLHGLPAAG